MNLHTILSRPVAVFLVTMTLVLGGMVLVTSLPIKLYPNTNKVRISVILPHPSYTAEDFEEEFGEIVDQALGNIEGVDELELEFNNGSTRALVWFEWGFDGDEARSFVTATIAQIQSQLPEETERYRVWYWSGRTTGFFSVAIYSDGMNSRELYEKLEPLVKPRLDRLKNVDIARINPVEETRVDIHLDAVKLLEYDLTPDEVATAIRRGYRDISLGTYRVGRQSYSVRITRGIDEFEDIRNIVLKTVGNTEVKLDTVADVSVYSGLPRRLYNINGNPAVTVFAMPNQDGNIRELAQSINNILAEIRSELPDDIRFQKLVDPGEYINTAIINVINAGLIGGSLAILVTLILLGDLRNTFLIATSIPLSVVLSFILLKLFDVTINLISLSGLTLAVGMVVDSTIVVMENIFRHLKEAPPEQNRFTTLVQAVQEVRGAVIASTLTSIVVFLPISFTSELTAAVLGDLSQAVIFVLVCSMGVALVIVPTVAGRVFQLQLSPMNTLQSVSGGVTGTITRLYLGGLHFVLAKRWRSGVTVLLPLTILVALLIFVAPKINREIMGKPDSPRVSLDLTHLAINDQEELLAAIAPIEKELLAKYGDDIDNIFLRLRRANSGVLTITTKSVDRREAMMKALQADYQSNEVWRFEVERWDPAELPLPRTRDLKISFRGEDVKVVAGLMGQVERLLRQSKLYGEVRAEPSADLNEFIALIPRNSVVDGVEGVTLNKLAEIGRVALTGRNVIEMLHNDELMDIAVGFPDRSISSVADIENLLVSTPLGGVPFKHFFDVRTTQGLGEVIRYNGERSFHVVANMIEGMPKWQRPELEAQAQQLVAENIEIPTGYSISFEDTQKGINAAVVSLIAALMISLVLVYVILGVQFNSLLAPLVITASVPLGLIGVITSLALANSTVSLNSMLGTILLGGIAVNNSILIYDFYMQRYRQGGKKAEAIVEACRLRIIPIVITTLTTILGMMPIAIALGQGTNVIQPLGIAVAGGLGVSSLLTVFVIPSILNLLPERAFKGARTSA